MGRVDIRRGSYSNRSFGHIPIELVYSEDEIYRLKVDDKNSRNIEAVRRSERGLGIFSPLYLGIAARFASQHMDELHELAIEEDRFREAMKKALENARQTGTCWQSYAEETLRCRWDQYYGMEFCGDIYKISAEALLLGPAIAEIIDATPDRFFGDELYGLFALAECGDMAGHKLASLILDTQEECGSNGYYLGPTLLLRLVKGGYISSQYKSSVISLLKTGDIASVNRLIAPVSASLNSVIVEGDSNINKASMKSLEHKGEI